MGRSYAGILGLVAFLVVVARAVLNGAQPGSTLYQAWLGLLTFAVIGFVIGKTAEWIIDDSLRTRVLAELDARQAASGSDAPAASGT